MSLLLVTATASSLNAQSVSSTSANNEVSIPITVLDKDHNVVTNLSQGQFAVFVDKAQQQVINVSQQDLPSSVVILLDVSDSMRSKLQDIKVSINEFLQNSNLGNEYLLIAFGKTIQVKEEWKSDPQELLSVINSLDPEQFSGGTKLYDACFIAMNKLKDRNSQRKIVLMITDGQDRGSTHKYAEILQLYFQGRIVVWGIVTLFNSPTIDVSAIRGQDNILNLAAISGGKAYVPRDLKQVGFILKLLAQLRQQYLIKFTPTGVKTSNMSHKAQVKVVSAKNPAKEIKDLVVLPLEFYYTNKQ